MKKIEIKKENEMENGWNFLVELDGVDFSIKVDRDYWQQLTDGKYTPERLVEKSFEFLLAREPKESILREFNLQVISNYFPEYEKKIRTLL